MWHYVDVRENFAILFWRIRYLCLLRTWSFHIKSNFCIR